MKLKLKKTVVLVGMMGAGKTAVGKSMAANLEVPFLDSDEELERAANMSIAEIFERQDETFFRERETQVISRLLRRKCAILSTGGGAFLQERNRAIIGERGVAVWLRADLQLLWSRVSHKTTRPLLHTADPYETLRQIYEERVPIYAKAGVVVDANAKYSVDDMARAVIRALTTRPDVLEEVSR